MHAVAARFSGGVTKRGDHTDTFSAGATLRVVFYAMQDGKFGELVLVEGDKEVLIQVPPGNAIICTKDLLQNTVHRHGMQGVCMSYVAEVTGELPPSERVKASAEDADGAGGMGVYLVAAVAIAAGAGYYYLTQME